MAIEAPIRPRGDTENIGAGVMGNGEREEVPLPVKMKRSWAEPTVEERLRHSKFHFPFRFFVQFLCRRKV